MGLPTDYVGTVVSWPLRVAPQSKTNFQRSDNRAPVNCTPSAIIKASFVDAPTIVTNGVGSDAGPNATTVAFTIDGSLASGGVATFATPCGVTATVTHATSVVAQTVDVTGTDQYGRVITETLTISAGGTSQTATTNQAFKTVTSATQTAAGNASANTCALGTSKRLGLPFKCSCVMIVGETQDGAIPTAGTLVAASTTAGQDRRGTYTPNATLNGALDFAVWYLSDSLDELY